MPLTMTWRRIAVQECLTRQAPVPLSPKTHRSSRYGWNFPKYRAATQRWPLFGCECRAHFQVSFHM